MAIQRIYSGKDIGWWAGYSGDVQPAESDQKITSGDMLHEIDTGAVHIYFNGGWHEDKRLIYAFSEALKEQP